MVTFILIAAAVFFALGVIYIFVGGCGEESTAVATVVLWVISASLALLAGAIALAQWLF